MTNHAKIYLEYFDYGEQDYIRCEACEARAVDIHHINGRGEGKDVIQNLMALCRKHHEMAHNGKVNKGEMQYIHNYFMTGQRKTFLV
jgi:predicted restriction endonuclease